MNNYFKYTPYLYLIVALVAAYKSIAVWSAEPDQAYLFLGITVLCLFMFGFRLWFIKRMDARNRKP
ncbi:hypothetical protein HYN48_05535 [Flavobacterium magnum]|uniref:Uncharacterized protein n=1 Tax=Flavobacterium magnum TaxID=2162713 RepID=A0A2S0RER4_9FLAO|nr:hypothetical protein [Flavobacterium magnum]AWA29591.1 hypothetical protein HYN48_05535 [Flavobacterium magnum]